MSFLAAKMEVKNFPVGYFLKIPAEKIIFKIHLPSEAKRGKKSWHKELRKTVSSKKNSWILFNILIVLIYKKYINDLLKW